MPVTPRQQSVLRYGDNVSRHDAIDVFEKAARPALWHERDEFSNCLLIRRVGHCG